MAWNTLITLACAVVYVQGHGRLMDPPNRGSAWRFGYNSPANYDDDGMNCGGFNRQYSVNDGKCGICGDAYDLSQPRPHELGGTYGLGYIVANYEEGQVIATNVYLSTSHLGFWELRICPDPYYQEQDCFDNGYLLELEEGGTKFYPTRGDGTYIVNFRLPSQLTCDHCVLQWQYTAGNNWGVCSNGTQGLGCGNQEQFYSCADISIESSASNYIRETTAAPETEPPVTDAPQLSPLIDGLTYGFVHLNPREFELLLHKIRKAGYRVFTGDVPVTSPNSSKKHKPKHRQKKVNKKKSKRHKKVRSKDKKLTSFS